MEKKETMGSVDSSESLNWFIENDGDMDISLNLSAEDITSAVNQHKKRNSMGSGRSRSNGSDSAQSDDAPSRTRHTRKKYIKRRDTPDSSEGRSIPPATANASSSSAVGRLPGNDPAFVESFERTMKTSSSRLSRSLSSKGSTNNSSIAPSLDSQPHALQSVSSFQSSHYQSSGDESGTGHSMRSDAALAAEQKFKDKNREHARNTRSRKKQYIEMLKQAFNELSAEREKLDRERSESLAKLAEQAAARKQALRTMFYYRATGELNREKWQAVLEEDFKMILPVTPYRSFPPDEVVNGQRHVLGIDAMVLDNASLAVMVQSIGRHRVREVEVRVRYYSGLDDTVMSGDAFMCRWILRTENAVECGACHECFKQGMVHAKFSGNNKLVRLELSYDVMCFMQQLRRASGKRYFEVVPNTVASATEDCDDPNDDSARILTLATAPYEIMKVSRGWCEMTGYAPSEVVGRTMQMLNGADTDPVKVQRLADGVRAMLPSFAILPQYCKDRERFLAFLRVCPLYSDGKVSHFIVLMERIDGPHARDDASINDAISATDSNMAIGYPPSPLSSLSSSSSNNSSINSRPRRKEIHPALLVAEPFITVKVESNHSDSVSSDKALHPLTAGDNDGASSTDQSTQSMSATNEESRSGSGSGSGTSDPTRASDTMVPSLSGNTDRSNDTTIAGEKEKAEKDKKEGGGLGR